MKNKERLEELRKLLVGKTILKVEPPNASEAICKIVTTDGNAFRLHATDLGWWTEPTVDSGANETYANLTDWLTDCEHHISGLKSAHSREIYPEYIDEPSWWKAIEDTDRYINQSAVRRDKDVFKKDIIVFVACDGKEFKLAYSKLSDEEKAIADHENGLKYLRNGAIHLGNYWKMVKIDDFDETIE